MNFFGYFVTFSTALISNEEQIIVSTHSTRGRCYNHNCYDHNFLQFLTIFGEKIGVFLKNQCYDQIFA
jgi:hypothetical protein